MPGIEIEIPREAIEQIAREVLESMLGNAAANVHDEEAERIERTLQRIRAKQFITIPEFALLFNCSRSHVDKLLDQAQQPNCKYPNSFWNSSARIFKRSLLNYGHVED